MSEMIDKTIAKLCSYIQEYIEFDVSKEESESIAEITTALAELVSARAALAKD